ncbi:PREDICTED: uncharacterized protein LOC104774847, partial [Camelina sativa]|uniref:Uncharacterized protein LOC104774847 n=1 Tax=Camelina sativa TaxID=90675 RepID=A0ABM0Y9F0_CAMSA
CPHHAEDGRSEFVPQTEGGREDDRSFSFRYDVKDQAFVGNSRACADLASRIDGDSVPLLTSRELACQDSYEQAVRRQFQAMSWINHLAGDCDEKVRAARKEALLAQDARVQAERSSKENAAM